MMEPGGFRIKRVGEDLPDESNETPQENDAVPEADVQPVIDPPFQRENPLRLANRPRTHAPNNPPASQEGSTCPECHSLVDAGAVICVSCGYNFQQGSKVKTRYDQPHRAPSIPNQSRSRQKKKSGPSFISNLIFYGLVLGLVGGLAFYFFVKPAMDKQKMAKQRASCKSKLHLLGGLFPEEQDSTVVCPTSGQVYEFYWPRSGKSPFSSQSFILVYCPKHACGVATDGAVKNTTKVQGQKIGFNQMRDIALGKVKSLKDIQKTLKQEYVFPPYNKLEVTWDNYTKGAFHNIKLQYDSIMIFAWREMQAHHNDSKSLVIKAIPGGKTFSKVQQLVFKKPKDIKQSQIKVLLNKEDENWLKAHFK